MACHPEDQKKLKYYYFSDINLENNNGLVTLNHQPFTGMVYSLYPNTKDTAEVMGFKNGREHAEWKQFFPNGRLKQRRFFDNGIKIKSLKEWWDNGKLKLSCSFLKGENHGGFSEWNREGRLVKQMHYNMGYEEGSQKQFYDNGKIRSNYIMKKGKRYGLLGTKNCVNVKDSIFKK
ncbi:toxin-antitoxin system YwqK family antitoxin [Chryseobacterium sp. GMJ5]|uniref:Toxin-antitoxin system YwqK family antitoxin n=1 Tax=Chryseobacterium gilvum TaxID=2976534 RepID=A0ABT2VTT6_9FLAO|nr:toxin-antitoxin system YwqK family antitoxin [Chryseobacterium gilvum]MCU7613419.1 toxin-antitoxin system YwqK family antitoxin [Chryseobacterium gilvum]